MEEIRYRCKACGKTLEKNSKYCENCWRKINILKIKAKKQMEWMKKMGFDENVRGLKIYKALIGILK